MDFERLGAFYLGKEYDVSGSRVLDSLVMYDARDLTTHGVCVGMTGSGKTGLCVSLLEEAAIDRVPALIIDPKGDITNLLLTFPELRAEDLRPWINIDDARRKGMSQDEYAAEQADLWRTGLADWGQDGARIRLLKESADYVIYTPGSDAGVPVSVLQSFAAPPLSWDSEGEVLRERIQGTVSALLGLIGVEADPVRSREHILLCNLFEHFWRQGEDLDLARMILAVQNPPIRRLGVFDVDTFFPPKERFDLAVALNGLMAAPGFRTWLEGQPFDVATFLATPEGKPRHGIFYIAHLSDAERMFFVTMLLNQVVTWMRTQPGTTSLRALLYMDEIAGFFPPVANPPSKQPMLTLLKQALAYGLGVLLTTQNPVDLDYKGLTNAGTWFIGRLQAERDKERLLDGLESVVSEGGGALDRADLNRLISNLGKRVFLLHNVHEGAPLTFHTRWAMSYLRGPLTRQQVRSLMADRKADPTDDATRAARASATAATAKSVTESNEVPPPAPNASAPVLPRRLDSFYMPVRRTATMATLSVEERSGRTVDVRAKQLFYSAAVLGAGRVFFVDRRRDVDEREDVLLIAPPPERPGSLQWDKAEAPDLQVRDLAREPEPEAFFEDLPETLNESPEFTALKKDLGDYLYRNKRVTLLYSPTLDVYSRPDEGERDFRGRLQLLAREERDREIDEVTERYEKRLATLQGRMHRVEATLASKRATAQARSRETVVSIGESLLGAFLGRRSTRIASQALSKQRQTTTARLAAERAEQEVENLREEIEDLQEELDREVSRAREKWESTQDKFEEYEVTPRRSDVDVEILTLIWLPFWAITYESGGGLRTERVRAF